MRASVNLNISLTMVDADSVEVAIREARADDDVVVASFDLPWDGDGERISALVVDALELITTDRLRIIAEVMHEKLEAHRDAMRKKEEIVEVPETWVCPYPNCGFVNVLDERCAKCFRKRQVKAVVS